MDAAWFLTGHAVYDIDFQKRAVNVISDSLPEGGCWEYGHATLKDRYFTLTLQPTVYAIPSGCNDDAGEFQLYRTSIAAPVNLDKRRAKAGLESHEGDHAHTARLAKENNWVLNLQQAITDELNKLAIDGGYVHYQVTP